jgi:hypothetical protein
MVDLKHFILSFKIILNFISDFISGDDQAVFGNAPVEGALVLESID